MASARDDTLAAIRRSLGIGKSETLRRRTVEERLRDPPAGVIPARGQVSGESLVALFREEAEAALATVESVDGPAAVPQAVAAYLRRHNLPASLRMGSDFRFSKLDWEATALSVTRGPSSGGDLSAVSHAEAGIAESGSLVLVSGPDNPSSLNFLPENHLVVLSLADLVGTYEALWPRIRARFGSGEMPRTLNFITGPSRSGDIEQTMLLGAHGPRRLAILLVGG